MTLRTRAIVTGALIAAPIAGLAVLTVDRVRGRDLELALGRVVRSQVNAQVRERCESDPRWFLTGPLDGRPRAGDPVDPNPDALPPRPKVNPQPFELFAYDEQFTGSSSAAPRFPLDMRQRLQAAATEVVAPYETDAGTGVQMAVPTGWIGGPCMYFLGRMEPQPDQSSARIWLFVTSFLVAFGVALAAAAPMVMRVRKLSGLAQESKNDGFSTLALDGRKDELNAVTFVYNEAVNELRLRKARVDDLDAGLRRFVQSTEDDVATPLHVLERTLALAAPHPDEPTALVQAHDLAARVDNLTAAAKLRMSGHVAEMGEVDLTALVARVVNRHEPLARVGQVSIETTMPDVPLIVRADEALLERAVANIVDNAVRYNRPDGSVAVVLARDGDQRFRLSVTDTGRGMDAEDFKTLTAIRRFRGDEHRNRRPGAPGLGLAVAKEVADRFGLQLDLKRPPAGGFDAEISGPVRI
jgi:signal transduction histidine kinase